MCIRVQYASLYALVPYDATRKLISIPSALGGTALAVLAVRRVLTELAIPQPLTGALCFCGEPVRLLALIPEQHLSEVIHLGA